MPALVWSAVRCPRGPTGHVRTVGPILYAAMTEAWLARSSCDWPPSLPSPCTRRFSKQGECAVVMDEGSVVSIGPASAITDYATDETDTVRLLRVLYCLYGSETSCQAFVVSAVTSLACVCKRVVEGALMASALAVQPYTV